MNTPLENVRRWTARDALLAVVLVVVTLVIYSPALQGGFIWNDDDYVTNVALRSWSGLARIWFEVGSTEQYYPLLHSAFWLQHRLWGDAPFGYHLVNVLLHAGNAVLLAMILKRLRLRGAWIAAALFALHPVCVESVAWIAEQKNTLSTCFYLLTALVYLRFDEQRRPIDYLLATALFIAALLSKSLTATLVGALLVVIWWQRGRIDFRRDVLPLLPWFVLGAAAGLFTGWVERTYLNAHGADFALTFGQRLLLAGRVVWFYLGKLAWPSELIFIYPRWEVRTDEWTWYASLFALVVLLAACWLRRHRSRAPLAALLFFIGSLFPVSGFFNVYGFLFSYVADHWQYLPSIGVFTLAGTGFASWADRRRLPPSLRATMVMPLLVLLGFLSWRQSRLYRDIVTFYQDTIAANPACWMAHNNLAIIYAEARRLPEAIQHYEAALRLKPDRFETHNNLGLVYVAQGRWQDAVNHFERAIQLNPRSHVSYHSIGTILRQLGRHEEAVGYYRKAIAVHPKYADGYNNLGLALLDLRQQAEALQALATALRLQPDDPVTHNNIGVAYTDAGRFAEAETHFQRAMALDPRYAAPHDNYGNQLRKAGRLPEAIAQYQAALKLAPDSAITLINLCIALTDAGRFPEAVESGQRAIQLSPDIAEGHFNLALALQGAGRLPEAVARYRHARQLKPSLPIVPQLQAAP